MTIDGKHVELRTHAHKGGVSPKNLWKVEFGYGLMNPIVVEADTEEDAKKEGLAESRKNSGFTDFLNNWPVEVVVKHVTLVAEYGEPEGSEQ